MITSFTDRDTKERALKDVYKMLAYSYMGIAGGFLYSPLELLSKEKTEWHTGIQNGLLRTVIITKNTRFGKKIILCGCDGTKTGKRELMKFLLNCMGKDYWCEASGVIEHWLLKHGLKPHPNVITRLVLDREDEIMLSQDGIHYVRKINGVLKEKAIYGNINKE